MENTAQYPKGRANAPDRHSLSGQHWPAFSTLWPGCLVLALFLALVLPLLPAHFPVAGHVPGMVSGMATALAASPEPPHDGQAQAEPFGAIRWNTAHRGIEYGVIQAEPTAPAVHIVRINPQYCDFFLSMASEMGASHSLADWARKEQFLVAINASMYLPDNKTSIGHMRSPTHTNNPHMGKGLGAFFVASPLNEPEEDSLPRADILERNTPDFEERLDFYELCVQNYRLISETGLILWKDKKEFHSITAIGKEKGGNILFFMVKAPMTVADFARTLQKALPDLGSVMYAEGGSKAAMYLKTDSAELFWRGIKEPWAFFTTEDSLLPNILGVKARQGD